MRESTKADILEKGVLDELLLRKHSTRGIFDKYSISNQCQNLVTYNDIPDWYSNNSYIHYGYRPAGKTILQLFLSIFQIHNETFNIWTHIFGIILFVGIFISFLSTNSNLSSVPIGIFLSTTILCFTSSVVMHTFYPHSKHACCVLCNIDYSGIFLLIFGGYTAFIHYEFYCYHNLQLFYYVFLILLGMLALFLICSRSKVIRSGTFLFLGASSIVPIIHRRVVLKGDNDIFIKHSNEQLLYIGLTLLVVIIGILFYITRIPERFYREFFNIILSSHQIFHVCTIIAAYIYYTALIELYDYYNSHDCE